MKIIFSAILLLLSLFTFNVMAESKYVKLVDEADKAVAKGDYHGAIALLEDALRLEPDNSGNVMLLSNLGMLNFYTGADSLAISYLSLAHEMAPQSVTILSNRAKVLRESGHLNLALNDLNLITSIDSTLYQTYLDKAKILLIKGDITNAQIALDRMSSLTDTSKSRECTAALAWLAVLKNDSEEALKQYSILIASEPTADLYASRAMCHVILENFIEASEDIAEGMKLDDKCAELYVVKACLNKKTYLNDDALRDAQKAIDLGADSRRVKSLLNL